MRIRIKTAGVMVFGCPFVAEATNAETGEPIDGVTQILIECTPNGTQAVLTVANPDLDLQAEIHRMQTLPPR